MNKYTHIEEFEPVELIIAYTISDVPEMYIDLLKIWLSCDTVEDVWDYGEEIRMIHWEWKNGNDYYLIIDIAGFPNNQEQGIICYGNTIIFENNNQVLQPLIKSKKGKNATIESTFLSRHKSFEYVRKITKDKNPHCINVRTLYDELKSDLSSETVSEDEFKDLLTQTYIHYSSDDASGLSTDEDVRYYDSESYETC